MTEPNKIFRSIYQEAPSYRDASSSRHVTYTMNCTRKRAKLQIFLKVLLAIFGFLLVAIFFIVVGLSLYPNLVANCKRPIFPEEQESEKQLNDQNILSLGEILSSVGICKEWQNTILSETNTSKIVNPLEKEDRTSIADVDVNRTECICPNSSKKTNSFGYDIKRGNGTPDIEYRAVSKCICNETDEIDFFEANKMRNESENYKTDVPNSDEAYFTGVFNNNETDTVNVMPHTCNCTNLRNNNNNSLDRNEMIDDFSELNITCECLEELNINSDTNETTSIIEHHDYVPLEVRNCECFKAEKGRNLNLNGSEIYSGNFDGVLSKDKECICPETPEEDDFRTSNTNNGSKSNITQSLNVGEEYDKGNLQVKDTESINLNKTRSETVESDIDYLNFETCICPKTTTNESRIVSNKFGVKTAGGDCICPEATRINNFNTTETNGSLMYDGKSQNFRDVLNTSDIYSNQTTNMNETPEILEIDNFDIQETEITTEESSVDSLNTKECVCPDLPTLLNNGSKIENNKRGLKTVDGECVCPETLETYTDDMHGNETEYVTENEPTDHEKNGTINYTELTNSHEEETITEKDLIDDDGKSSNSFANLENDYVETENEKEVISEDEKETVTEEVMIDEDYD